MEHGRRARTTACEALINIVLTLCALIGATLSGIVGMGGGAFLLACMILSGIQPAVAIPLHATVQLVSNTTRLLAHFKNIRWRIFAPFAVFALPGPVLGLIVFKSLDTTVILVLLGVAVMYAAWARSHKGTVLGRLPEIPAFGIAGFLCGTLGVVIGAVGPIMAPFFLREDLSKEQIIATKAISTAFVHVLKIIAFASIGFAFKEHVDLFIPMSLAVIAGTLIGKWLLGKLSEERFRLFYRIVLTALALRLMLKLWV